jgi:mannose-6-phosphate isomerase
MKRELREIELVVRWRNRHCRANVGGSVILRKPDSSSSASPISLRNAVQQYQWGRALDNSVIATLSPQGVNPSQPVAELWVGAHPSAPSTTEAGHSLIELIEAFPAEILGEAVHARFGSALPFLFKVLSIDAPLSIQVHPDRPTAAELHAAHPDHYPDPNAKPEIGVAISKTTLLYGFRPVGEVLEDLAALPQLSRRLGLSAQSTVASLSELFPKIYQLSIDELRIACEEIRSALQVGTLSGPRARWHQKVAARFIDGDVGVLAFLFLNLVELLPGDAVFIAANVLHAYLDGELVECMANSDNVIRAGLTAKFCDVDRLLSVVDYSVGLPDVALRAPLSAGWEEFTTPAAEFSLQYLREGTGVDILCGEEKRVELLFCLFGQAEIQVAANTHQLNPGSALLLPADSPPATLRVTQAQIFRVRVPR